MWYNLNFLRLLQQYMMTGLRRDLNLRFMSVSIQVLQDVHDNWRYLRADDRYKLNHNGQVCYLRKALNDRFDVQERRIYIDDLFGADREYIYTPGEEHPRVLGKIYINSSPEYADTGADFTVYVPASIVAAQKYELQALINYYKAGGKRYIIIEI